MKKKFHFGIWMIGIPFGILGFILLFVYNVIDTGSRAFAVIHRAIPAVFFIFMSSLITQMAYGWFRGIVYLSANVTNIDVEKFDEENERSGEPKKESEWLLEVSKRPQLTSFLQIIHRLIIIPNLLADCIAIAYCFTPAVDGIMNKAYTFTLSFAFAIIFISGLISAVAYKRRR